MSEKHNDTNFSQWIKLREKHKKSKREKDYKSCVNIGKKIIELSKLAPHIGIMTALFERDTAEAYVKLNDIQSAISYYTSAIRSFEKYRTKERLNRPDDFLADIEKLQKKLIVLGQKISPRHTEGKN